MFDEGNAVTPTEVREAKPDTSDSPDGVAVGEERTESSDDVTTPVGPRRISLSLRTLVVACGLVVLLAAVGVMTYLYLGERHKVQAPAASLPTMPNAPSRSRWTTR